VGRSTSRLVAIVAAFAIPSAGVLACGGFDAYRGVDTNAGDGGNDDADDATRVITDGASADAPASDGRTSLTDAGMDVAESSSSGADANRTGYWFVTSSTFPSGTAFPSGLTSLSDADALCVLAANASSLTFMHGRTWKAFLGADNESPKDRVTPGALAQYQRPDHQVIGSLDAMLNTATIPLPYAPCVDENGAVTVGFSAWTAAHSGGTPDNSCTSWTDGTAGGLGMTGTSSAVDSTWVHAMNAPCNEPQHLYCMEQR
jgi:hypothetical protein